MPTQDSNEARSDRPVRRGMRVSIWEGAFATAHGTLTSGAFLTGFALLLGVGDAGLGIFAAVPFLAQIFQLFSAFITERTSKTKLVTLLSGAGSRLLWVIILALPFLVGLTTSWRANSLIILFGLSWALMMVSVNAWTVWMGELIPGRLRGRYFGTRNVVIIFVGLVVGIGGGLVLDWFQGNNRQPEGFAVIFGVAVVAAVAAAVLLAKQPSVRVPKPEAGAFWRRVASPLADGNFRRLMLFFAAFNFSWAFPLAFWNVHMLRYLRMSYFEIAVFNAIFGLTAALGNRVWGKVADRTGNKAVAAICGVAIGVLPLLWLAPRPGMIFPIWLIALFAGWSWSGFNLAAFTMPLAFSPRDVRTYYVAVFGIVTGAVTFVGSAIGGVIADGIGAVQYEVAGVTFINYHYLFLISAAGRLLSVLLLKGVKESKYAGIPETLAYTSAVLYDRFSPVTNLLPSWLRPRIGNGSH